ncbi:hypothetical protein [Brevibacterium sp. HMSC24B04]|uniref:hypothetical protein n=1 Tax=Brevibacterium sp. HMSC24B04 TaxID=1581060 RepID=UPI0008C7A169|nr:hypothetical protein [Brevibacterium sp. HMSC24B04]OFT93959.1 hypothetical protein HMPREF3092_04450 [Brevibacterium sp. HMSC24B04]
MGTPILKSAMMWVKPTLRNVSLKVAMKAARVAANMIVSNLFSAGCAGAEVRAEGDAAMKPLYVG